jgi:hypothetical protein
MSKKIAEVRLAPGEVGYYDDYSRIYLNTSRTNADIFEDTNIKQIRKSVRSGRLRLVSGSLDPQPQKVVETTKTQKVTPEVKKEEPVKKQVEKKVVVEELVAEKEPEVINEEIKIETAPIETVPEVEVKVEEVAKPEPRSKRRSRRKSE